MHPSFRLSTSLRCMFFSLEWSCVCPEESHHGCSKVSCILHGCLLKLDSSCTKLEEWRNWKLRWSREVEGARLLRKTRLAKGTYSRSRNSHVALTQNNYLCNKI